MARDTLDHSMGAEVIAIGSGLLLGRIVDTNSAVIARHFAGIGLNLSR